MQNLDMSKSIIAVVVTYNRKELLKEAIEALLNQHYTNCKILVIDNASTDGTREFIDTFVDNQKVIYRNTGANLGGAGGFNFGMKVAAQMEPDFIWLMDDDCIVHKHTLSNLVIADEKLKGDYGFLSSKVLWKDGNICKMNIQRKTLTKKNFNYKSNIVPIVVSSFVSCFIPFDNIKIIGLPISDFFIWADDWEYTRRLSRKYSCYLVNKSVVTHKTASNNGSDISKDAEERLDRYSYAFRNEGYIFRREGLIGVIYYITKCLYNILKVIINRGCNNKKKRITIVFKGLIDGLKFNPKIEFIE